MQNDFLQDWQTIWQSELAAMAVDREGASLVAAMAKSWTDMAAVLQAAAKEMADGVQSVDVSAMQRGWRVRCEMRSAVAKGN